ncbi:MAG TPA: signal peptidase I [Rhizomicrobium sp.]|nr:signal peptidase I [Rhizomicrobium sp.]
MADHPIDSKSTRHGTGNKARPKETESWGELAKTVIYAGLIAVFIRTFLFQPFNIPSGSMENTLLIGDYLFVEKFAYGFSRYTFPFGGWPFGDMMHGRYPALQPHRGDVIVFKFPGDNSTDFIKRLIGLPGDRIQMINDVLYLNGKPLPRVRVADYVGELDGEQGSWPQYRETLPGGKSYVVIDKYKDGPLDNTQEFVVPPGHYFMMGDNRDNSNDSREEVGYVPAENLEGKAIFRFFSTDGSAHIWEIWKWPFAIRYSRILTLIH